MSDGRVEVVRSGGVAGRRVTGGAAADELSPAERAALDALLERPPAPAPGRPDRFVYELVVAVAGTRRSVRLAEADLDDRMRPLLDRLLAQAPPP